MKLFQRMTLLGLICMGCGDSKFSGNSASNNANAKPVFSSDSSLDGFLPKDVDGDGTIDPPSQETVAALQKTCEESADKQLVSQQAINYPERKECRWRSNPTDNSTPNLERKDRFVQASESSTASLNLPQGVICDINLRSPSSALLHYDDFLILNLNQKLLFASNKGLTNSLEKSLNTFAWDWSRLAGKPIQNFEAGLYCIGPDKECKLPGHDQKGPVAIDLKSASIAPIALSLIGQTSTALDLIATGDNDDQDCFHSNLDLTVEIKYLPL